MSLSPEFAALSKTACRITLPVPPLLESWEGRDHPSQVRLASYRASIATFAAAALGRLEPPLALGFHVAGRPDIAAGCDLDNFLTPIVRALGGDQRFALVWASRGRRSEASTLILLPASDARVEMERRPAQAHARLSASATSPAWKQALAVAVGRHETAVRNGPTRNRGPERADRTRHPIRGLPASELGHALEAGDRLARGPPRRRRLALAPP